MGVDGRAREPSASIRRASGWQREQLLLTWCARARPWEIEAAVIGISKDSVISHDKFKKKYELPFTLASDEKGEVCEAYGVWVEKSMYGRKYMGIERATFLIDEKGVVRSLWRKVKVPGHVDAVLAAAKAL